MSAIEAWLLSVLCAVHAQQRTDFAGLGLVFYIDRKALPVYPLVPADCALHLPTGTLRDSIELLTEISCRRSECHDGFHLVDAKTLAITDVSQFLSPPIPPDPLPVERRGGARHMAARLASLLPSVSLTAVYTSPSEATLYEQGDGRAMLIGSDTKHCSFDVKSRKDAK